MLSLPELISCWLGMRTELIPIKGETPEQQGHLPREGSGSQPAHSGEQSKYPQIRVSVGGFSFAKKSLCSPKILSKWILWK